MKLKPRQSVRHSRYGWGSILECDRHQTTVYFHTVGIRRFATSLATFVVVQNEAPKKRLAG